MIDGYTSAIIIVGRTKRCRYKTDQIVFSISTKTLDIISAKLSGHYLTRLSRNCRVHEGSTIISHHSSQSNYTLHVTGGLYTISCHVLHLVACLYLRRGIGATSRSRTYSRYTGYCIREHLRLSKYVM
jgi:hypothetical protein